MLDHLPRAWWFPSISGYRPRSEGTYSRSALDEQPRVVADEMLAWLEHQVEKSRWAIGDDGHQARALTPDNLSTIAGDLPLPRSLQLFARRPDLQRRIRSATACYLDLGDFRAPTTIDGSYLIHILSDQQWGRHWLLYLDEHGREAVVTTVEPIGFDLPDDWPPPPPVAVIDGTTDLEVGAHSFAEFLYRFWIENELWFAVNSGSELPPPIAQYAQQLAPSATRQ